MSLRVNTNLEALNVHRNMVDTTNRISDSLKRLSSGKRINSAKDDAAGFAVANKFRADIAAMRVGYQNASEAQSLLQTADGGYSKINDILVRMKALATQAASDQTDRDKLTGEFGDLITEIGRIATSTVYNDQHVTDGTGGADGDGSFTFQIGQTNATDNQLTITLDGAAADSVGVDAVDISGLDISDLAGAQDAMDTLDDAMASLNKTMGTVGAYQNRLQYSMENLAIGIENFSASESAIRDVDMADEVMNFSKSQILQQTGMAMMAQANQGAQQILALLQ
jgi:flagellin